MQWRGASHFNHALKLTSFTTPCVVSGKSLHAVVCWYFVDPDAHLYNEDMDSEEEGGMQGGSLNMTSPSVYGPQVGV